MLNFDEASEAAATPTPAEDGPAGGGDVSTTSASLADRDESLLGAAARTLELASTTAEELVAGARAEAQALVTAARAEADGILQASRAEAYRVSTESARAEQEQAAELDRERVTALAGLAEEISALESRVAMLRSMQREHCDHLRRHLTQQLELLDRTVARSPLPPADAADRT